MKHGITRRRFAGKSGHYAINANPLAEMNITPLIDVMLVLLVMMILVMPVATHKIPIDLPGTGGGAMTPQVQTLRLSENGVTFWNDAAISDDALFEKLKLSAAADDELKMQTEPGARYENFAKLIARVKRAGITKLGFVGNANFAGWDAAR